MKTKRIVIIGVVLLLAVMVAGCVQKDATVPSADAPSDGEADAPAVADQAEEKTPVEIYFDKTKAVEVQSAKGKAVDAVLLPILSKIYDVEVEGEVISGVKFKEEFGPMLTYVFNRVITVDDVTAIKTELEVLDFQTQNFSAKGMNMSRPGDGWVFTFKTDNQDKAIMEITH